jgi:blue copper oxidase
VREAFLSPSERLDVLIDLTNTAAGDVVWLKSLAFDPMHQEGGHGADPHAGHGAPPDPHAAHGAPSDPHAAHGAGAGGIADGAEIALLKLTVGPARHSYDRALPGRLSAIPPYEAAGARTRRFTLDIADGRWRINGLTYDIETAPVTVARGTREIWEIHNVEKSMPHPMHVHGFPFRIHERRASPRQQARLAVDAAGLAASDLGWKDTVLVWPGETVRILIDFTHAFEGDQVYMFHCHNLEHEDRGMMINFRVA